MPQGSLALLMWTMGVTTKKVRTCVSRGRKGRGRYIYVNNIYIPSGAVCITQHGPVVMAIATGQMMQMRVHLVMNLSSADGCLTRVHSPFATWKPEALQQYLKYSAADVWMGTNPTHVTFSLSHHVTRLCLLHQLIRRNLGKADETRPRVYWINASHLYFLTSSCPLLTAVSSCSLLLNYTDKAERLIGGGINCPFSF